MFVRFLAVAVAVALTACGGSGSCNCDSDGNPLPPVEPPTCAFPTGVAPTLLSPGLNATVAAASVSQVVISDTNPAPYRRQAWTVVISTDSNPSDFFDNTSAYVSTSALMQQGTTTNEVAGLPANALQPGLQYFSFIVTSGCEAAGPIGQFFTS